MAGGNNRRLSRAFASLRNEWHEAPWLVVLIIVVVALVGPGLLWAGWTAVSGLF